MRWKTDNMLMTGWIILSVLLAFGAVAIMITARPAVQPMPPATMSLPQDSLPSPRYQIAGTRASHRGYGHTRPTTVLDIGRSSIE